jgi:hypothetical protein
MSASAKRPEDRIIGAGTDWLAQVSEAARRLTASQGYEQLPNESGLAGSSISVDPARDRFLHSEVPAPLWRPQIRSGLVLVGFTGILLSVALTAVVVLTQFRHADEASQLPLGHGIERGSWSGPLPPAIVAMRDDLSIPHLIVQSSRVMAGELAPLKVAVEGRAEDTVVIITGLMSGMELSTGSAVGGDAWELPATDLHYAWIAPPGGFVGSVTVVVELRLSPDRIIDRQIIQLEWTTAISTTPPPRELNREESAEIQPDRQEINEVRATSPAVAQSSLDLGHMIEVPANPTAVARRFVYPEEPTVTELAQQVAPEEVANENIGMVRRSGENRPGGLPSGPRRVSNNPHAVKGFWDWSR